MNKEYNIVMSLGSIFVGAILVARFVSNDHFWSEGLPGALLVTCGSAALVKEVGDC